MDSMKSISTGNSLIKTCTCVLDAIYSSYDCIKFLSTLQRIENNLSLNYYESVDSLKEDIQENIPQISEEFIDSVEPYNEAKIPEEYSTLPIYSSIKLKKESKMYSVHIKSHHQLHSSIYNAIENSTDSLHRLYIIREKELIEEVRDNINSILCLFFDVELEPDLDDSDVRCIKAKVAAVHALGDFHPTESDEFEGWIKVKIAHTNTINTKIPAKLAHRLFEKREQTPRKIILRSSTDRENAIYNEITRQFMANVMQSHTEKFESRNSLPVIKNMLTMKKSKKNTQSSDLESTKSTVPSSSSIKNSILPNLYQSASKVLNLITSTSSSNSNNNQASDVAKSDHHESTDDTSISPPPQPIFTNFWKKLEKFCYDNNAEMVPKSKYDSAFRKKLNASGFFKHVYFTEDNNVLQIFQRSTASQRIIEIASLLALKDEPCIGRIKEVIYDKDEVIGLTMDRYEMTLKDYLHKHTHQRLNAEQRMDIVIQMLESIKVSHQAGIAHRDLSTVNFMINSDAKLYLIDYGKAVFLHARDAKRWWVESDERECYKEDVKASTREELAVWCRNLPYVMARPDHGYRFYRSIQTLPKSERDRGLLPHLIDPAAEDIYSLGTMIWKIFSGLEPWPGVFDTDLKKLREIVDSDFSIDRMLDRSMPGPVSKMFLQMFLRVEPRDRMSAADILYWIQQDDIKNSLIDEWSASNGSRRTAARNNIHCRGVTPEPSKATIKLQLKDPEPAQAGPRRCGRPPKSDNVIQTIKRPIGRPRKSVDLSGTKSTAVQTLQGSPLKQHSYYIDADGIKRFVKSGIMVGRKPRSETVEENPPRKEDPTYIIDAKGVKRFAKSGIIVGRKSRSESVPPNMKDAKVPKKRGRAKTVHIKEEYTESLSLQDALSTDKIPAKKPNPNYKYVPTGKPRGRPKKQPRTNFKKKVCEEEQNETSVPEAKSVVKGMKTSQESMESTSSDDNLRNKKNNASDKQTKTTSESINHDAGSSIETAATDDTNHTTTPSPTTKLEIGRRKNSITTTTNNTKNTDKTYSSSSYNTTINRPTKRSADDDINHNNSKRRHSATSEDINNATTSKTQGKDFTLRIKLPTPAKRQSTSPTIAPTNGSSSDNRIRHSPKHKGSPPTTPPIKDNKEQPLKIKLPGQPKNVLDKETMELVSRSSLSNMRDSNRSMKFVGAGSPKPSLVKHFSKHGLSPPSPQSPALSPVSNTETVEDIASPVSPVPAKRKFEGENEKSAKRRNTTDINTTPVIATADNFDIALYNILQRLDATNNVH